MWNDDLPEAKEGDPLSAEIENRIRRALQRTMGGAGYADAFGSAPYSTPPPSPKYPLLFVPDFDVPAYGVVVLDGDSEVLGDDVIFAAVEPDGTYSPMTAINGPVAVASGAYGRCGLAKTLPLLATYDGDAPAVGDSVGADVGGVLVAGNVGYRVLAVVAARTLVLVETYEEAASITKYGKLDAQWTNEDDPVTATVSIWRDGEDTTENETATMSPWITTWDLAAGTWIMLTQYAGEAAWYAEPRVSQAVHTGWQFNATSEDIEKKTRTAVGPFVSPETDWTKVDDTNPCA